MATTTTPPVRIISDAELATAAAAGDRNRHLARAQALRVSASRLLRDGGARSPHRRRLACQDAFCIAAAELPKLREPDKLRPWLYAIARRAALRTLRERRREPAVDDVPDAVSVGPRPVHPDRTDELAALVMAAAHGLSDRDRDVLELAYRRGLAGPELADALGVSHDCAKKLLQRLRQTFERSLGALLVARRATNNGCPSSPEPLRLGQTVHRSGSQTRCAPYRIMPDLRRQIATASSARWP